MRKDKSLRYDIFYQIDIKSYAQLRPSRRGQAYNENYSTYNFELVRFDRETSHTTGLFFFKLKSKIDSVYGVDGSTRLNNTYYEIYTSEEVPTKVQFNDVIKEIKRLVNIDRKKIKGTTKIIGMMLEYPPINITERWNNEGFNFEKALSNLMDSGIKHFNDDYRLIKDLYIEPIF